MKVLTCTQLLYFVGFLSFVQLSLGSSPTEGSSYIPHRQNVNSNRPLSYDLRMGEELKFPNRGTYTSISDSVALVFYDPNSDNLEVYQKGPNGKTVVTPIPRSKLSPLPPRRIHE